MSSGMYRQLYSGIKKGRDEMANRFLEHFGGIVTLNLLGARPEKIINMALTRGIFVWDLKRNQDSISFKIRSSGYEALRSLADENGYELEVIHKRGLPFMKSAIKRRLAFLGGAMGFILALYFLSSFIWFINVSGNEKISEDRILSMAARYGVYKGSAKWNFSRAEAEEAMLREIKQLTYIKIDIRGVRADIQVVEKILPGEEITEPCHLLAAKEGVIEEILVLEGQAQVREGEAVARGEVLISGIVIPQPNPYMSSVQELNPYLVRARGIVKARVWYEGYGECGLYQERRVFTGQEKTLVYLKTPGNEFKIFGDDRNGYTLYETLESRHAVNSPLGKFILIKKVLREQALQVTEYSDKEARKIAEEKALQVLAQKTDKSLSIDDVEIEVLSSPSESMLRVKAGIDIIEDIGRIEPINKGGNGN